MSRINDTADAESALEDLQQEQKRHREEAAAAMEFYKSCVDKAVAQYEAQERIFRDFVTLNDDSPEKIAEVADALASGRHDLCSDSQQDKGIPAWNRSAQPGATYFMSNETHYVHIIFLSACSDDAGPTRFSRNIVYTRSEEANGAKTSNDTLSTLADSLLGAKGPRFHQPPLFRTGYDRDGKID